MRFPGGIQSKFILLALFCIVLFAGSISSLVIQREEQQYTQHVTQQGLGMAQVSGVLFTNARIYEELGMVDTSGMGDYLEYFVADIMRMDPRVIYFVAVDGEGRVIAHKDLREFGKRYNDPLTLAALGAHEPVVTHLKDAEGAPYLDIGVPLSIGSKRWGACRLGFSLRDVAAELSVFRREVLALSAFLFCVALAIVGLAGKRFAHPLHELTQTMNRITERGDLDTPVTLEPVRGDEIGELQASFLWMMRRLREAEKERIHTLELMHHTEKMATVGQLASGVAHEINNPLGGVILCFRNLVEGDMDENMRRQHVDVINQSLEKIRRTVRDLLDLARRTPLEMQQADVCTMLERSLALAEYLLARRGIRVVQEVQPDMPTVPMDADKMSQVVLNLLINAAHAMADGGELRVAAGMDGQWCSIRVADSGPGVPDGLQERIFDPFFTTKEPGEGTGLGLAVSAAIVRQHGGSLALLVSQGQHEAQGQGAVFEIRLPLAKENA